MCVQEHSRAHHWPSRGKRPGILLVPCRWHKLKSEEEHEGSKTRRRLSAHKGATSLVLRPFPPGWLLSYLACVLDHETAHGAAVDAAQVTEHRVRSGNACLEIKVEKPRGAEADLVLVHGPHMNLADQVGRY
ncbi:hypothetical protein V8C42DRAFT_334512 [Trichoderma barbatum]